MTGSSILLTGFGPFPGMPDNASTPFVRTLTELARGRFAEHTVIGAILPTEWREGPQRLLHLLDEHRPEIALHIGVSSEATTLVVETRALNAARRETDAAGLLPPDDLIRHDGPPELPVTLPASRIFATLEENALPARLSDDAGGYLCNCVLYHSLMDAVARHTASRHLSRRGFLHLPASLSPTANAALTWSAALAGALLMIETASRE